MGIPHSGGLTLFMEEILAIANRDEEHIYVKGDGSLDDGMELVSHSILYLATHEIVKNYIL